MFDLDRISRSILVIGEVYDRSIGDPVSWYWKCGDGAVSTEQIPVHEYLAPGSYTVSLRVFNDGSYGFGVWKDWAFKFLK